MPSFARPLSTLSALFLSLWVCAASAQNTGTPSPARETFAVGSSLALHASDANASAFDTARLRNKVSVVFFWSSDCAVCRNSLPELRANAAGWRDKPFVLLTVNVDRKQSDWLAYERLVSQTQMPPKNLLPLRQDASLGTPAKLPLTLLVDAQGKIVARYDGRLAPEAWDGVADLLL